jgi:hypothetical protein
MRRAETLEQAAVGRGDEVQAACRELGEDGSLVGEGISKLVLAQGSAPVVILTFDRSLNHRRAR